MSHLIKVRSWNASLRMLQLYISLCLKSFLRYKCLISDTGHPDTLYVRQQGCEEPWLFFEAKMGPANKKVCKTPHQTGAGTEPRLVLYQHPIKSIPQSALWKLCSWESITNRLKTKEMKVLSVSMVQRFPKQRYCFWRFPAVTHLSW